MHLPKESAITSRDIHPFAIGPVSGTAVSQLVDVESIEVEDLVNLVDTGREIIQPAFIPGIDQIDIAAERCAQRMKVSVTGSGIFVEVPRRAHAILLGPFQNAIAKVVKHGRHITPVGLFNVSFHNIQLAVVADDTGPLGVRMIRGTGQRMMVVVHPVIILQSVDVIPVKVGNHGCNLGRRHIPEF